MPQNILLSAQLPAPVNAAFSQTDTDGVLPPSTTYYYRVSALDGAGGETLASTETSGATSAAAGNTHAMVVNWTAVAGATGYKVYGRGAGVELLIATVGDVTTYTDTGSITPAGALPASNTTGIYSAMTADVTVAAGARVGLAIYPTAGIPLGDGAIARVWQDTPGGDILHATLTNSAPSVQVTGPGTFRVFRTGNSSSFGVFSET